MLGVYENKENHLSLIFLYRLILYNVSQSSGFWPQTGYLREERFLQLTIWSKLSHK